MTHVCPCGASLLIKADLEDGDDMDRYLASMMGSDDGYCADEDDMVPLGYAAEIVRRQRGTSDGTDPVDLNCPLS